MLRTSQMALAQQSDNRPLGNGPLAISLLNLLIFQEPVAWIMPS